MTTLISENLANDSYAPVSAGAITPATAAANELTRELKLRVTNQLISLGDERDLKDAGKIRGTLALWAPDRRDKRSPAGSIARKILVDAWQEARLPDPIFDRIRPIEYPWSESARDLFFAGKTKSAITLEHVKPASYLLKEVLFPAAEDPNVTDEMFLDLLNAEHSRLSFTIVSKLEDDMINHAGFRDKHVESEDDWARYTLSGIDTSTFMALVDDERFDKDTMLKTWAGRRRVVAPLTLV
jgi:hypothetical protein